LTYFSFFLRWKRSRRHHCRPRCRSSLFSTGSNLAFLSLTHFRQLQPPRG
jgi:hypothetical protein